MHSSIKKIIIICLLFLSSSICFASEQIEFQMGNDYLITTDENITTTLVANPNIVTLNPFFTIFNEKNVVLVHPKKVGKTTFTIFIGKNENVFNVTVISKKAAPDDRVIEKGCFEIMMLDSPPTFQQLEINEANKSGKEAK